MVDFPVNPYTVLHLVWQTRILNKEYWLVSWSIHWVPISCKPGSCCESCLFLAAIAYVQSDSVLESNYTSALNSNICSGNLIGWTNMISKIFRVQGVNASHQPPLCGGGRGCWNWKCLCQNVVSFLDSCLSMHYTFCCLLNTFVSSFCFAFCFLKSKTANLIVICMTKSLNWACQLGVTHNQSLYGRLPMGNVKNLRVKIIKIAFASFNLLLGTRTKFGICISYLVVISAWLMVQCYLPCSRRSDRQSETAHRIASITGLTGESKVVSVLAGTIDWNKSSEKQAILFRLLSKKLLLINRINSDFQAPLQYRVNILTLGVTFCWPRKRNISCCNISGLQRGIRDQSSGIGITRVGLYITGRSGKGSRLYHFSGIRGHEFWV